MEKLNTQQFPKFGVGLDTTRAGSTHHADAMTGSHDVPTENPYSIGTVEVMRSLFVVLYRCAHILIADFTDCTTDGICSETSMRARSNLRSDRAANSGVQESSWSKPNAK